MANERQLSDESIMKVLKDAASAHEELTNTVGKMHDTLLAMGMRLDLLQEKVVALEQRLARGQR
jgi:hypothetical protein